MSRIRILPEQVANRIAAGEVVERPASVVKELLENALDAGARAIRIDAESGGRRLIRVADDGCGMSHDDALLAFERHATSKLRSADDLLSIATLGFRGEALPSIASVSRLVLETCPQPDGVGASFSSPSASVEAANPDSGLKPASTEGTRVEFAGGKLISVKSAGLAPGTTISVGDLFYCVPARRKFLKSDTTELGHIASVVTHYALANPDRAFTLRTPTQEIIAATPVATMGERVYQLFGREALGELIELKPAEAPIRAAITEPALEPGEERLALRVSGFISRPEVQRANRNGTYIFVNRRLIRDRLILHAVNEAYRNIIPPGVFPVVLLFLEMPPEEVDVNVHPAKVEVRFRHANFVHDFTRDALRQALMQARPVASFAAAGVAARGTGLQPVTPADESAKPVHDQADLQVAATQFAVPYSDSGLPLHDGFALTPAPLGPVPTNFAFEPGAALAAGAAVAPARSTGLQPVPGDASLAQQFTGTDSTQRTQRSTEGTETEERRPEPGGTARSIATLKPLGQVSSSFIVAVNGEGLWLVDQHVAHERILFERHLQARREGALTGQRLLLPIVAELSPRQSVVFEQIAEELAANGFDVHPMGARSVAIHAAPADVEPQDAEKLLRQILDGYEKENEAISMETLQAKIAASTACHAAIKVNMPLDQQKMEWLLEELAKTDCPMACPHGRPVVLRYSLREIEKAFKRS